MDPASISALLSGVSSLGGGLSSLFGGDSAGDAADRALDQAREQFQQGQQAQTTAARRNLALFDEPYQSSLLANRRYLQELGLQHATNDPVLASMQHNADNYIAVGPDGRQTVVNTIPGYTGGNTPRPITGVPGPQQGGQSGGLNFNAPHGTPIGTVNGTTYYSRDEDSLMPYNWAGGTGFQQTPGYQFQMEQGIQARDRGAASRGMLLSGAAQKELTRFGQGTANQEYGTWLNRIAGVAGQAPQATSQVGGVNSGLGAAGAGNASQLADLALSRGMTGAASADRSQSAFSGGLANVFKGLGSISSMFGGA